MKPMFELGKITMTHGVFTRFSNDGAFSAFVDASLLKYAQGDWGDTCEEDAKQNDISVKEGERIFATYRYVDTTVWIITEWDRSATTILFPSEY